MGFSQHWPEEFSRLGFLILRHGRVRMRADGGFEKPTPRAKNLESRASSCGNFPLTRIDNRPVNIYNRLSQF